MKVFIKYKLKFMEIILHVQKIIQKKIAKFIVEIYI